MRYVTKGGFWLSLGEISSAITGTVLIIAFANLIPEETYGIYKYVISTAGIIGAFTLSGMKYAVTQAVAKGYDGALKQGFKETLKWSWIIVVLSVAVSLYYFSKGNPTLGTGMLLIGIFYPVLASSTLYGSFLVGKKDFKRKTAYFLVWEIVEVGVIVLTMLLTSNILWILLAFFITNSIPPLVFYFHTLKIYQPENKTDPETVGYSKHLSVMYLASTIAKHIDKVLVFQFLGATELAIYTFATLPIQKLESVQVIIRSLALPKFSIRSLTELRKTLPRKLLLMLAAVSFVVVIFIISAPTIYQHILPKYTESVQYARVFALSLLFLPGIILGNVLIAHAKKKDLYVLNLSTNAAKIVLLLVLLPLYGIWGCIFALLIDRCFKSIIAAYMTLVSK